MGRSMRPIYLETLSLLNDPASLIPEPGATATQLRAAAEKLAARCRVAELQRADAEMVLRRIVYRRRRGQELIRDTEVIGIEAIATRNASPLRAVDDEAPIRTREGELFAAARRAVSFLNQANPGEAERVLRRAMNDTINQNSAGGEPGPDTPDTP